MYPSQINKPKIMSKALENIAKSLQRIEDELADVKRGVYGDPVNKKKGLLELDEEKHNRIKVLEEGKKKIIYISCGAVATIEMLYWIYKSYVH